MKPKSIHGTIALPPQFANKVLPSASLLVLAYAADPKTQAQKPVAGKRFPAPLSFPLKFELTSSQALIPNTPLDGSFYLVARISQSGQAETSEPGDIEGVPNGNPVQSDSRNVEIELNQMQ